MNTKMLSVPPRHCGEKIPQSRRDAEISLRLSVKPEYFSSNALDFPFRILYIYTFHFILLINQIQINPYEMAKPKSAFL